MSVTFKFIDLFAGIGGFYQGLSKNGGECIGYSEINKDAIETYCENYNEKKEDNLGDITKIKELPPHDILTAVQFNSNISKITV
jgi:DNA (cytosine-5)-methyltransferase 1